MNDLAPGGPLRPGRPAGGPGGGVDAPGPAGRHGSRAVPRVRGRRLPGPSRPDPAPAGVGHRGAAASSASATPAASGGHRMGRRVMAGPWHYLDHAATSPLRPEARAAMDDARDAELGNPSGAHATRSPGPGRARGRARGAGRRRRLRAGRGGVHQRRHRGRQPRGGGRARRPGRDRRVQRDRAPRRAAPGDGASAVGWCRSTDRGRLDLDALAEVLDDDVRLVSVMLVNNEVGTVQDLGAVAEVVRRAGAGRAAAHRCRPGPDLARPATRPPHRPTS